VTEGHGVETSIERVSISGHRRNCLRIFVIVTTYFPDSAGKRQREKVRTLRSLRQSTSNGFRKNTKSERIMHIQSVEETDGTGTQPGLTVSLGRNLVSRCFVMEAPFGFHVRPAALFATTAQPFKAELTVSNKAGLSVNGKSIMGLLRLEIMSGEELVVTAEGPDSVDTLLAIERLFASVFCQRKPAAIPISNFSMTVVPHMFRRGNDRICT
jgi:phosphocarrier protein HPr